MLGNTTGRRLMLGTAVLVAAATLPAALVPPYAATPAQELTELQPHIIQHGGNPLHYVEAGTPGKPLVVFVHGTPGSWQAFTKFLQHPRLRADTHMLALDRPGLGESAKGGTQPSFQAQSHAIVRLFAHNRSNQPIILVGHSLGGSIAFRVAIDNQPAVGGLLSISSSIDPSLGKPRWFNRLANLPVLSWAVRGKLRVANDEIMQLQSQLSDMEPGMRALDIPITVMQGGKDKLVSPANVDYARRHFASHQLRLLAFPDAGHFFIWEQPELVVAEIMRLTAAMEPIGP